MLQIKQKTCDHFVVDELEQALLQAEEVLDNLETVASYTELAQAADSEIDAVPSEDFAHFDPDSTQQKNYDIGSELGLSSQVSEKEMSAVRIADEKYHKLLQCFNVKQREFYNYVCYFDSTQR